MTRYVKKRIPIEAFHYNPQYTPEHPGPGGNVSALWNELNKFTGGQIRWTSYNDSDDGNIQLHVYDYLHETWVKFHEGDWIIKGIRGEFYPVEVSVFEETYEEHDESRES